MPPGTVGQLYDEKGTEDVTDLPVDGADIRSRICEGDVEVQVVDSPERIVGVDVPVGRFNVSTLYCQLRLLRCTATSKE